MMQDITPESGEPTEPLSNSLPDTPPQLAPGQIDNALKRKRKARPFKACYPCRRRKVKCDREAPCRACRERDHSDLCDYVPAVENGRNRHTSDRPSTSKRTTAYPGKLPTIAIESESETNENIYSMLKAMASDIAELKIAVSQMRRTPVESIRDQPESCGHCSHSKIDKQFLVSELFTAPNAPASDPSIFRAVSFSSTSFPTQAIALCEDPSTEVLVRDLFTKDVLALFGMDNESATYPFVDLWGLPTGSPNRLAELAKAFPNDSDCWVYLKSYKETAHIVFPALGQLDDLESELLQLLLARSAGRVYEQDSNAVMDHTIFGKDLSWCGLMFAILASGAQGSSLPRAQRELTSKAYVCCSFECLRMRNFLSNSNIATIQTLLILGNVMCNNINAGIAWSLLGLTTRLAQMQGLHREPHDPSTSPTPTEALHMRTWWCVVWQDSFLSITLDRASSNTAKGLAFFEPNTGKESYAECVSRLSNIGLDVVSECSRRRGLKDVLARMKQLHRQAQDAAIDAADHLRDLRKARSRTERLEHSAYHFQRSFIVSQLCRPALAPIFSDCELARPLREACIDGLTGTVAAFMDMHEITQFMRRSWLAVYRALSCSLLLAILRVPAQNTFARTLVERLVSALANASDETEMTSPVARALDTLQELLDRCDEA